VSNFRGPRSYFNPMNKVILVSFYYKGGKNISTNNKKVRGEGISLSEAPFRDKTFSRLAID
jgi:hypothetical protein